MITIYWRAIGGVMLAVVLCMALAKQGKDFSLLVTIGMCCLLAVAAIQFLQPVVSFLWELQDKGNLNRGLFGILLKSVGIGLLAQIVCVICSDAGNTAMSKALQILASVAILSISMPLLQELLRLVESVLNNT